MARLRGTTLYPEDESVLDEIAKAWAERRHGATKIANIKHYLERLSGQSEDAKIKRARRAIDEKSNEVPRHSEEVEALADMLGGKSVKQQIETIKALRSLEKSVAECGRLIESEEAEFRRAGIYLSDSEREAWQLSMFRFPKKGPKG